MRFGCFPPPRERPRCVQSVSRALALAYCFLASAMQCLEGSDAMRACSCARQAAVLAIASFLIQCASRRAAGALPIYRVLKVRQKKATSDGVISSFLLLFFSCLSPSPSPLFFFFFSSSLFLFSLSVLPLFFFSSFLLFFFSFFSLSPSPLSYFLLFFISFSLVSLPLLPLFFSSSERGAVSIQFAF